MPTWRQYNVHVADRAAAEDIAVHHLHPVLAAAHDAQLLHGWWYMRKQPWRLRCLLPDNPETAAPAVNALAGVLDELAANRRLLHWGIGIYEPETLVFGGEAGMDVAHQLFHHDSHYLLTRAGQDNAPRLGQREITVLLCSAMLRAASLDWYEQGDVWAKLAALRPPELGTPAPEQAEQLQQAMRRLMTADTRALCQPGGPLDGYDGWLAAFTRTGQALADLARHGRLQRGLRAVLAHHIVFHANRAGLTLADQSILAALALDTVFHHTDTPTTPREHHMTPVSTDRPTPTAEQLRTELTDNLRRQQVLRSPAVETAFRRTPRHLFLPAVPLEQAYADTPVYTKHDGTGAAISAASQPWIVAMMLEQLDARPGQRIMEAGAGTGYNAALIGSIVGPHGHVTTIDVDKDLVDGAREHLTAAGATNVDALLGDGALGHPQGAPYDRIIATVGAWETPTAWLDQLTPDGRLIVPLRLRGTASRSIVFRRDADAWRSRDSQLCVFMPLRGIGDDARRTVTLTPEQDVTLQVHKDQTADTRALTGVLDTPARESWTGVMFPPNESMEWLDLWLCCRLVNPLMRVNIQTGAKVTPPLQRARMATVHGSDLVYLTTRAVQTDDDGSGKLYEVGIIGHGPDGADFAEHVAQEVRTWDTAYRHRSVRFELPDTPQTPDPAAGRFVLDRPHHPITVIWE